MATEKPKQDDHPQIPGVNAMAWFALITFLAILSLVLFLQFKFGTPAP